jgi:hypothetical protein
VELAVALGLSRRDTARLASLMRKRGLIAPATGNGVVVASVESLATLGRGPIFDGRGKIFFTAQEGVAPLDHAVFTVLRPERLPLEDAEVEAEIERLKALPLAEYEAQREPAASRLGVRLSVLDRLRSDGAKEQGSTAVPQPGVVARPERRAVKQASLAKCVQAYIDLIRAYPDGAPQPREVLAQKMMNDFRVTWHESRDCRREATRTGNLSWSRQGRPRR